MTASDPVISKLRAALDEAHGNRIERIVLYRSRARGDAKPESDYDVAVFLNGMKSRWEEFGTLAEIETDLLDEKDAAVHAMPHPAVSRRGRSSPLMHEIRKYGLDL